MIHNSHDFIRKKPFLLYMLTFKSLYNEALKQHPGVFRMKSTPFHYITSFSHFQWAINMGYSGKIYIELLSCIISMNKEKAVEFIDYLRDTVPNITFQCQVCISRYAAEFDYLHLLQWLQAIQSSHQTTMYSIILCDVAKNGNLTNLKLLFEPNSLTYELSQCLYSAAAQSGNLDMLIWLQSLNPLYPPQKAENLCTITAEHNHLHILQWLRLQNPPCPWDENTCNVAVRKDNLCILQWLRSQNPPCPWNQEVCMIALNDLQLDTLEWIQTQTPPIEWNIDDYIEEVRYLLTIM